MTGARSPFRILWAAGRNPGPGREPGQENARAGAESGFTFIELAVGAVVIAAASSLLITHLALNYSSLRHQRERAFAFSAAQSILSEVKAFALDGMTEGGADVDSLDDGAILNPTLSIARANDLPIAPDNALSGNSKVGSQWAWYRQVQVRRVADANSAQMRQVTVRIYKSGLRGARTEIATLSSVVISLARSAAPTQVFDVYLLAIENIPGWWVHMETIRPFMEAMLTDLERSNPGLWLRSHWITKASYGRDELYRPFVNDTNDSNTAPPGVYYYPGLMPAGNTTANYYVAGAMRARIATDSGNSNDYDANRNPHPYTLADRFNHGMRYPRERAHHERRMKALADRKAAIAATPTGTTPPANLVDMSEEPTYRLLLEDMCTNPDPYRNALLVNLHGELLPMPALRNYSDAAKSPSDLPGVRVVTHPEELRTRRDPIGTAHDDAVFRVYAYTTDPDSYSGKTSLGDTEPIVLEIPGVNLVRTDGTLIPGVSLECLSGGLSGIGYTPFAAAAHRGSLTLPSAQMYYEARFVDPGSAQEKFTRIKLVNTPVRAPLVGTQGLASSSSARLYGMEYVPSCTGTTADFSHTLAASGTGPKNTARWRLRIGGSVLTVNAFVRPDGTVYNPGGDLLLTVRTRIQSSVEGAWETTGTAYPVLNNPYDLSETYTWWADSRDDVPFTERSQFNGDPRYNPYKDLLNGDPDFPNGYNWYFDSLQNLTDATTSYAGLDKTRLLNCWQARANYDVLRYFELLRTGIVRCGAVYTTMMGYSYYYMGLGGEIGYDAANGYPNSIPVNLATFGGSGTGFINTITGTHRYVRSTAASYWWGIPWLGETHPDASYSTWRTDGNLRAGTTANRFYRGAGQLVYSGSRNVTAGTSIAPSYQRLQADGCTAFFNVGTSVETFQHRSTSGSGSLIDAGLELASSYNMLIPTTLAVNRPFSLQVPRSPDGWDLAPYSTDRYSAVLRRTYCSSPVVGYTGSGLLELTSPDGSASGFVVVSGLAQSMELGTNAIAKYSLVTLLHSYFEAGSSAMQNRITMPPRVEIKSPVEWTEFPSPTNIDITFETAWTRWDGKKYTASTADTFTEMESDIVYSMIYSRDNGRTWHSMIDDLPVTPGQRPSDFQILADSMVGDEVFAWSVPAIDFPTGTYVVRVEAYRSGDRMLSFDQMSLFIQR